MTDTEILLEIRDQVKRLNDTIRAENRTVFSTAEACDFLQIGDTRPLDVWFKAGILTQRYGAQKSGYKWSKREIIVLQAKLLTGEVTIPKRQK